MMVVGDINEMFLPLQEGFLVNPMESKYVFFGEEGDNVTFSDNVQVCISYTNLYFDIKIEVLLLNYLIIFLLCSKILFVQNQSIHLLYEEVY